MNDRKKTVLLLLLIFVVFGLVGWRVAGIPNQVTPPAGSTETNLEGSNGQPAAGGSTTITLGAGSTSGSGKSKDKAVSVAAPTALAGPDPFRNAVRNAPALTAHPVASAPRVSHPAAPIHATDLDQPVAPLKGDILPAPGGTVDVRPDPAQELRVSGVITGDRPIAILKLGDHQYLVHAGDSFGDGYVLKSVSTTQVVITQGKKTIYLPTLGG